MRMASPLCVLSPNSTCLASRSLDHSVKLYKDFRSNDPWQVESSKEILQALNFQYVPCRLTNQEACWLRLLMMRVSSLLTRLMVLKGHKGSITGLAMVNTWPLFIYNLKGIAPDTGFDVSTMNVPSCSWVEK